LYNSATRHMHMKLVAAVLPAWLALAAGETKGPPKGEGSDKFVRIEATAFIDKASASQAVGGILDDGIVVVEVKLTPAEGKKLTIDRDDFLLRSDRSGERSTPYSPSQIAGSSVMRVSSRSINTGSGVQTQNTGPGGGGGLPGMGGQGIGNGTAQATEAAASVDEGSGKQKENPLLAILKQKILAEKEIGEPVSGQLYFLMEGKQKAKDLELLYKTEAGRVSVRFKQLQ
jgi:hypothetical protein